MAQDLLEEQKELLVRLFDDKSYVPMKLKELAVFLDIPKSRREELKKVLDLLMEEGKIGISKKGKYGRAKEFARVGIFTGHARGFRWPGRRQGQRENGRRASSSRSLRGPMRRLSGIIRRTKIMGLCFRTTRS